MLMEQQVIKELLSIKMEYYMLLIGLMETTEVQPYRQL